MYATNGLRWRADFHLALVSTLLAFMSLFVCSFIIDKHNIATTSGLMSSLKFSLEIRLPLSQIGIAIYSYFHFSNSRNNYFCLFHVLWLRWIIELEQQRKQSQSVLSCQNPNISFRFFVTELPLIFTLLCTKSFLNLSVQLGSGSWAIDS